MTVEYEIVYGGNNNIHDQKNDILVKAHSLHYFGLKINKKKNNKKRKQSE